MKKILVAVLLLSSLASAQVITGPQPFGSFGGGSFDSVNLGNLNVNFTIPINQKSGRGANFFYILSYNNSIWFPTSSSGILAWQPIANYGWQSQTNASAFGYLSHTTVHGRCSPRGPLYWSTSNWVYHDLRGATHALVGADSGLDCTGDLYADPGTSTDGTGITLNLGGGTMNGLLTTRDGRALSLGDSTIPSSVDTNGNEITTDGTNYADTLGATALTVAGTPPNPVTYSFTNSSGGTSTITANYTSYTIQTNFACSGIAEYSASANLMTSLVLPDGTQYQFTYEQTPGYGASYTTGRIASVTLPTTGKIIYTYTGGNSGINCSDGSTSGLTRALQSAPPATDGTWTYARAAYGSNWNTTITDPAGNQAVLQFATLNGGFYEVLQQVYQGSINPANLLLTVTHCYNGSCNSTISSSVAQIDLWTQAVGEPQSRHSEVQYNVYGLPTSRIEWNYGDSLVRTTTITYASPGNGIVDHPSDITMTDSGGNKVAETQISYDETALTATSGAPNHDYTNHSSTFTQRGNATTVKQWVSGTTFASITNAYDDLGNLRSTTDAGGHLTTFDFTDNYNDGVNHSTQAFATTITAPTTWFGTYAHVVKNKYYWPSAMLYQATDQNNQVTTYTYDNMWRTTNISYPDGGQTNYTYSFYQGLPDFNVSQQTDATHWTSTWTQSDGLGRSIRVATQNGGEAAGGWNQVDTCYNARGQVTYTSYRYQGVGWPTSSYPCSGNGDSFTYDPVGRTTSVTHSDGNSILTTYYGRAVQVQDEGNGSGARVTRVYQQDALGRTVAVCELAASMFGIQTMPTCGLDLAGNSNGVTTSYTYDALDRVSQIAQGSLIARQFTYDGLSHVLTETIPEMGGATTSYTYNIDGLLQSRTRLSANQAASCLPNNCTTTTTNYGYDALHRLWTASYSDTPSENTHAIARFYDTNDATGSGYNIGHLTDTATEDRNFTTAYQWVEYAYDQMGRVTTEKQLPNGNWFTLSYGYNLLGQVTTANLIYFTLTNNYNVSGQTYSNGTLRQVTSNYVNADHPGTLLSGTQYNAGGEVLSDSLGNGVNENFNYDARARLLSASATKGTSTIFSLGGPGTGNVMTYTPNSGLAGANDSVNGNWTYSYDPLSRIAGANKSGGTNFSFDVDRNANRWHQNPVGQGAQLSFDATTNHIATGNGVTYDAAGNIINDGVHSYTYDAEYRITQVDGGATASYAYDALGRRIQRTTGGNFYNEFFDLDGNMVVETKNNSLWTRGEIYAGGRHLGTYAATTTFSHSDWLGTERVRTDSTGAVWNSCTSNIYGDNQVCSGNTDPSPIHYAGMEYDAETQLYHTAFRYYNPRLGVWMTPDPSGLASSNPRYPQSLNRYAYVLNNPARLKDPTGLECVWDDGSFDSEDDPETGNAGACQMAGGTWIELGQGGDWSNLVDPNLEQVVSDIKNGLANMVSAIGKDGNAYVTFFDSDGRVSWTVGGGFITAYSYASNQLMPTTVSTAVDYGGNLATTLRAYQVQNPGLPLNIDARAIWQLANSVDFMTSHPFGTDARETLCTGISMMGFSSTLMYGPFIEDMTAQIAMYGTGVGAGFFGNSKTCTGK